MEKELILRELLASLPHGSGIDYDWSTKQSKTRLILRNAFHYMNEYGYYDGVLPFRVVVKKSTVAVHFEGLNGAGWYRVKKGGLLEYLNDIFGYWFDVNKERIAKVF